ncbi:MAG: diguanylate cyclase, partial [Thermoanaerobaculia bacterium]
MQWFPFLQHWKVPPAQVAGAAVLLFGAAALLLAHWRYRLKESEERFRKLADASFEGIAIHREGEIVMANRQLAEMCGYEVNELIGRNVMEVATPEYVDLLKEKIATGSEQSYRGVAKKRDGTPFLVQLRGKSVTYQGRPARVVAVVDVTAEAASTAALKESERRYRQLFESNLAGVFEMTDQGEFTTCNNACGRMLGFEDGSALLAAGFRLDYCSISDAEHLRELLRRQKNVVNAEICVRRADGVPVWMLVNVSLSEDPSDSSLRGTIVDVTDRHRAEQQAEFQMYHDALTQLPNRALFREQLHVAVAHAERQGNRVAVMLLDLDRFKNINDSLGHGVGDELIRLVSKRVITAVGSEDTVCRSGGDEFAIIVPGLRAEEEAVVVATSILHALHAPFVVEREQLFVSASVGIALYPDDGQDGETLMKHADHAMYTAKDAGRNTFRMSSPALSQRAVERMALENSIRRGLERKEFALYYQPVINLAANDVVAA